MPPELPPALLAAAAIYIALLRVPFGRGRSEDTNRRIGVRSASRTPVLCGTLPCRRKQKIFGDLEIDDYIGLQALSGKAMVISKTISKVHIFLEGKLETDC